MINPARNHSCLRASAIAALLALAFATAPAANAADMNKVIRHVFPAGEEGFDPAAAHVVEEYAEEPLRWRGRDPQG